MKATGEIVKFDILPVSTTPPISMQEYEEGKKRRYSTMRSITDYGMGVFFILVGIVFLTRKVTGWGAEQFPVNAVDYVFGVMALVYGGWRLYRGYKKKYYK